MENPTFEISLNGKKIALSRIDAKFGVMTAMVTWAKRSLDNSKSLNVVVSGLDSVEQKPLKWLSEELSVGDILTVSVTDSDGQSPQIGIIQLSEELIIERKLAAFHKLKEELQDYL